MKEGEASEKIDDDSKTDQRAIQMKDHFAQKRKEAVEIIEQAHKKQESAYDERHKVGCSFKVGQKVLKRNFMRSTRKSS